MKQRISLLMLVAVALGALAACGGAPAAPSGAAATVVTGAATAVAEVAPTVAAAAPTAQAAVATAVSGATGGDAATIKIVSSLPRTGSSKAQTDTLVNAIKQRL